jgi:phosphoribosylformimino-5-aminoimidazole carboxamide ribotide isomerase
MHIIPVLDLLKGQIVRGVAGQRQNYRPVVSKLTASSAPLDVARAFRDHFNLTELYLADLDAIGGSAPALATYEQLQLDGFALWVDAGLRQARGAERLAQAGVGRIIAGLETMQSVEEVDNLCQRFGPERIIFSLDLKDGNPLSAAGAWPARDADAIAREVVARGVRRLVVLDLARVGVGGGTTTDELCARLVAAHAGVEVVTGGGVRDAADLWRLAPLGVWGALVASALHDGRITADSPGTRAHVADWPMLSSTSTRSSSGV